MTERADMSAARWRERPDGAEPEDRAGALMRSVEPRPFDADRVRERLVADLAPVEKRRSWIAVPAVAGMVFVAGLAAAATVTLGPARIAEIVAGALSIETGPSRATPVPEQPKDTAPSGARDGPGADGESSAEARTISDDGNAAGARDGLEGLGAGSVQARTISDDGNTAGARDRIGSSGASSAARTILASRRSSAAAPGEVRSESAVQPAQAQGDAHDGAHASTAPSSLALESAVLREALTALEAGAAPSALAALDRYDASHPSGVLRSEASIARVHVLLALERTGDALTILQTLDLARAPRALELTVLRGELRVAHGQAREALADLSPALAPPTPAPLRERALYATALARSKLGEHGRARELLRTYLAEFPEGRFAKDAQRALAAF